MGTKRLDNFLNSVQGKSPADLRLAGAPLAIVLCAFCGSGARKFRNCGGDHLTQAFLLDSFPCYHPERMRETEVEVLRSFSYQELENIYLAIFLGLTI